MGEALGDGGPGRWATILFVPADRRIINHRNRSISMDSWARPFAAASVHAKPGRKGAANHPQVRTDHPAEPRSNADDRQAAALGKVSSARQPIVSSPDNDDIVI